MTKAEIVQRLLDEHKITAEEAVTLLLSSSEKEYVYIPTYPAWPRYPYMPVWYSNPFPGFSTTTGTTTGSITINTQ